MVVNFTWHSKMNDLDWPCLKVTRKAFFQSSDSIVGTMWANPVNVGTNSKAGSGTPGQDADGSIAVHPVTSEDIPGRTLIVVWAPELQQCPMVYVLIDAGAVLDSSGNSLVGLVDSDSNFVVTESERYLDFPGR